MLLSEQWAIPVGNLLPAQVGIQFGGFGAHDGLVGRKIDHSMENAAARIAPGTVSTDNPRNGRIGGARRGKDGKGYAATTLSGGSAGSIANVGHGSRSQFSEDKHDGYEGRHTVEAGTPSGTFRAVGEHVTSRKGMSGDIDHATRRQNSRRQASLYRGRSGAFRNTRNNSFEEHDHSRRSRRHGTKPGGTGLSMNSEN